MNKFLILILFIALIYLAYSYRHYVIRGGIFTDLVDNEKFEENKYTKDKDSSDFYKLYMNVIILGDLEKLFKDKGINNIGQFDASMLRDVSSTEPGDEDIHKYIVKEQDWPEFVATPFINLGKLLNSENFKRYKIGINNRSLQLFYRETSVCLINIYQFLKYIKSGKNASNQLFKLASMDKDSPCILFYSSGGNVYTFDLWRLNDNREKADEYLEYYNSINNSDEFNLRKYRSPGLFIDSNIKTMNDRDNSRKVGKAPKKLSPGIY